MSVNKKQKLELTWIGKASRPRLEPCVLLEEPEKSYHAQQRIPHIKRFVTVLEKNIRRKNVLSSVLYNPLCHR
jgi:hypothetical protein